MLAKFAAKFLPVEIARHLTAPKAGGGVWYPWADFFAGSPGAAFDFTDGTLLYTDSARTTPATGASDPVGSATDISGYGNHASQSTAGSRPTRDTLGILFGDPRFLQTSNIDFSGADAITVVASIRKISDASTGYVCMLGADFTTAPGVALNAPAFGAPTFGCGSRGTGAGFASTNYNNASEAAPISRVLTGEFDISADLCRLLIDGVSRATSATDQGTGNYQNSVLTLGRYGASASAYFTGYIARFAIIGRTLSAGDLLKLHQWAAAPYGITI